MSDNIKYGTFYLCYWTNEFDENGNLKDKFMTTTFIDTEVELRDRIKEINNHFPSLEVDFYGRMIEFTDLNC